MFTPDRAFARPDSALACASIAAWSAQTGRAHLVHACATTPGRTWRLGPLTFVEMLCDGLGGAPLRLRRDGPDRWTLEASASQAAAAVIAGQTIERVLGAIPQTTQPAATVSDPLISGGVMLLIPGSWRPGLSAGLARNGEGPLTGPAAELLALLLRETPARLCRMAIREEAAVADMFAALLGASVSRDGPEARRPCAAEPERARVSRVIHENIGSARLDARRICALTGLSRSTLYRLFEGESGVAAHVRALRLRLVMDDLLDPALREQPISVIAERRGFHCAASFNRTFRRAFGRTPSETRAAALSQGAYDSMGAAAE